MGAFIATSEAPSYYKSRNGGCTALGEGHEGISLPEMRPEPLSSIRGNIHPTTNHDQQGCAGETVIDRAERHLKPYCLEHISGGVR